MRTRSIPANWKPAAALTVMALAATVACSSGPAVEKAGGAAAAQAADTIYTGGDIVTVNDAQPTAEAVAVKGGKILAVGTRVEVERAHKGTATQTVDLGGKTLLPSFLDAHGPHQLAPRGIQAALGQPSGPARDVESIASSSRRSPWTPRTDAPKGVEIIGFGYDNVMLGRPASQPATTSTRIPGQPGAASSTCRCTGAVLEQPRRVCGYSAATKTPPGGVIRRKPGRNEPDGVIEETAFLPVVDEAAVADAGAGGRQDVRRRRAEALRGPASPPPTKAPSHLASLRT